MEPVSRVVIQDSVVTFARYVRIFSFHVGISSQLLRNFTIDFFKYIYLYEILSSGNNGVKFKKPCRHSVNLTKEHFFVFSKHVPLGHMA